MKRHIPNFITSLNLASGFASIILIFNGNYLAASWLILAAMAFDFLDGFASRILNAYSDLGKELDSLADVVSFGVAPGLMIFNKLESGFEKLVQNDGTQSIISDYLPFVIAVMVPVCAGIRLAKFNTDTEQATSFKGLPTPAAALATVTVIMAGSYQASAAIDAFLASPLLLTLFALAVSGLMVSRIPLISFKFKHLRLKGNEGRYLLIAVSVLAVILLRWNGAPLIIPAYIAISLGFRN